jgi:hypothetical protein
LGEGLAPADQAGMVALGGELRPNCSAPAAPAADGEQGNGRKRVVTCCEVIMTLVAVVWGVSLMAIMTSEWWGPYLN